MTGLSAADAQWIEDNWPTATPERVPALVECHRNRSIKPDPEFRCPVCHGDWLCGHLDYCSIARTIRGAASPPRRNRLPHRRPCWCAFPLRAGRRGMKRLRGPVAVLLAAAYIASVVLANVLTERYGLVSIGLFGLVTTAGTFAAGATLLARNLTQDVVGCDSADGTYIKRGPDKNLPKAIAWQRDSGFAFGGAA